MIRTIFAALSILIFFVFSVILFPVKLIVERISPKASDRMLLSVVRCYLKILMFISGVKVTVKGKENLLPGTPVLYVPNHRSYFDVVITLALFPELTSFVAKKEFRKLPLLSWWIIWLHGHFIDRENVREALKTILDAIETIKSGISVAIFPEGQRSFGGDERNMLPFHEGSFKIATKTGCPIIPVTLTHTSNIFEDHVPFIKRTHVTMEYGRPVYPSQLSRDELKGLGKKIRASMEETIRANY